MLGKYIADFYSAEINLVIELAGSGHYTQAGQLSDAIRTAYLEEYGITVLRIPNNYVTTNFRGV